jgi:hypothetical protein
MSDQVDLKQLFDRTTFLLGAGASIDAGCLSSKGMLLALQQAIRRDAAAGNNREFSSIYEFILQSLVYQRSLKGDFETKIGDLANVEDFVAVLRQMLDREYIVPAPLVGNWNARITGWEQKDDKIFSRFLDFTYDQLLQGWTRFNEGDARGMLQPLKTLVEVAEDFTCSLFSLNYDLIFETVFNSEQERLLDTGFSQKRWTGDFFDPNGGAKLKLFKLHGSSDWYFEEAEEDVKEGRPEGVKPLIVFGSGAKLQSYDPFLSLLASFRESLKKATLFVVIGYSFQDKYINNILIQSLGSGLNKKMLVVDPNLENDRLKFVQTVERFQATRSMSELLSLTKLSPERIELCRMGAREFFERYFANKAAALKAELIEAEKGDQVF